mmetsp:Transcript_24247/g.37383  ORF Transcript_24247/g.37383 Transcript_24247/m.37383 type:complete len:85 (-) Transcript_24247:386-640(-)
MEFEDQTSPSKADQFAQPDRKSQKKKKPTLRQKLKKLRSGASSRGTPQATHTGESDNAKASENFRYLMPFPMPAASGKVQSQHS